MKKTTIIETITIFYIILFLYTGISKIIDYTVFKEQIAVSPILAPAAKPIAILLPLIEFVIVAFLITPRWRLRGLYASLILMTCFTIYIASMLLFSEELPCSCGGIISELSWKQHIGFNSVFILLATTAISWEKKLIKANKQHYSSILYT